MVITDVEFACSANVCRSIIAEAIGGDVKVRYKQLVGVRLSSSGSRALDAQKSMKDPQAAREFLLPYLDRGVSTQALDSKLIEAVKAENDKASLLAIEQAFEYEWGCVKRVLGAKSLKALSEPMKQMVVRPDSGLILAMNDRNVEAVQEIYKGSRFEPEIANLSDFSVNGSKIEYDFFPTYEEYEALADNIHAAVIKAFEHYISKGN
ncbi:MAG: hypothetical protein ABIE22_01010 [archaeon]